MDENRIKEVFSDEAFVKGLVELETPEEVQTALKEKGVELTVGEIMQLRDGLIKAAEKAGEGGELSLDQLDDVAGGIAPVVACLIVFIGFGAIGGGIGAGAARLRW